MPDWNERYRRGEYVNYEPAPLLLQAAAELTPGRALDVACGAGRHAAWLARGGWQVTGVDASEAGIELARARNAQVDWRVADLERGEFVLEPNTYDLICVFYYLQRDLFPHLRAALKTGGAFIAAIHTTDAAPDAKRMNPAFLLAPGELRELFHDWRITHYQESANREDGHHRSTAEIVATKTHE